MEKKKQQRSDPRGDWRLADCQRVRVEDRHLLVLCVCCAWSSVTDVAVSLSPRRSARSAQFALPSPIRIRLPELAVADCPRALHCTSTHQSLSLTHARRRNHERSDTHSVTNEGQTDGETPLLPTPLCCCLSAQPKLVALFASRSHVASLCAAGACTPVRCAVLLCAAGVGGAAVETFQLPAAASFQSETKDYQQPAHTTLPTGN